MKFAHLAGTNGGNLPVTVGTRQSSPATVRSVFNFGEPGDIPLGGDWDGRPSRP